MYHAIYSLNHMPSVLSLGHIHQNAESNLHPIGISYFVLEGMIGVVSLFVHV